MTSTLAARAAACTGLERRAYPVKLEVRAAPTKGGTAGLEGYASVVDEPYEMFDWLGTYGEVVRSGAFAKTLGENPAVQLLVNHGGLSMAYTNAGSLRLAEDTTGLHIAADVNTERTDVADMVHALADGAVDEMSFAFRVTRQMWSPDYDQRDILEVDLHKGDVSVVNFGANPATSVALRAASLAGLDARTARAVVTRLQTRGARRFPTLAADLRALAGRAEARALLDGDAAALTALLTQLAAADAALDPFVDAMCGADEALDAAQLTLAGMLGIPNPDAVDDDMVGDAGARSLSLARAQYALEAARRVVA